MAGRSMALRSMIGEFRAVRPRVVASRFRTIPRRLWYSATGMVLALGALSRTDPLTGLRNQRAFEGRLADEVARAGR